jgi:hypothetical protein
MTKIDREAVDFLKLIISDCPSDYTKVIVTISRGKTFGTFDLPSRHNLPRIYRYTLTELPHYLMGKRIVSNVPRNTSDRMIMSVNKIQLANSLINLWGDRREAGFEAVAKLFDKRSPDHFPGAECYIVYFEEAKDYINEVEAHSLTAEKNLNIEKKKKPQELNLKEYWNINEKYFSYHGKRIAFNPKSKVLTLWELHMDACGDIVTNDSVRETFKQKHGNEHGNETSFKNAVKTLNKKLENSKLSQIFDLLSDGSGGYRLAKKQ